MVWSAKFVWGLTPIEKDLFDTKDLEWVKIITLPYITFLE
jgi:hypothetical protein